MPRRYREMYRDAEVPLPENFMTQHSFDAGVHQIRDEVLADYPRKPDQTREHLIDYYAMITHADAHLGRPRRQHRHAVERVEGRRRGGVGG